MSVGAAEHLVAVCHLCAVRPEYLQAAHPLLILVQSVSDVLSSRVDNLCSIEVSLARMRSSALVWSAVLVVAAAAAVHFWPRGGMCGCPHLVQILCVFLGALGIVACIILEPAAYNCVH